MLPNADVAIAAQDLLRELSGGDGGKAKEEGAEAGPDAKGEEERKKEQEKEASRMRVLGRMGRALELCGDVGVWVEWVGGRMGKEE